MGPAGPGELLLFLWFPELCHLRASGEEGEKSATSGETPFRVCISNVWPRADEATQGSSGSGRERGTTLVQDGWSQRWS